MEAERAGLRSDGARVKPMLDVLLWPAVGLEGVVPIVGGLFFCVDGPAYNNGS